MFTTGGSKIYTNRIVMNSNSVLFQIDYFIRNSPYKKVKGSGNIGLSDNSVRSYKSLRRIWDEFENHIGGTVKISLTETPNWLQKIFRQTPFPK